MISVPAPTFVCRLKVPPSLLVRSSITRIPKCPSRDSPWPEVWKALSIVLDGEIDAVAFISELNLDATCFRMADRIGHRFLPDTNKMMDALRSKRQLGAFDIQRGGDRLTQMVCAERPSQRLGKRPVSFRRVA